MSLKELTWEHHQNAERQDFVKILLNDIDKDLYATFLYNQFPMYELLEIMAMKNNMLFGLQGIERSKAIFNDFKELWDKEETPPLCAVTKDYLDHIMSIQNDPHKLMAHIYVRHMGDLSGGQMIAKKVPGSCRLYHFDEDVHQLKEKIRKKVDDSMADEAKICFDFATRLFQEMMQFVEK